MNGKMAWRKESIGRGQWEANCSASSHLRPGDTVSFHESRNTVSAWISGTSVMLGAFFIGADERDGIVAGAGWCHE